MSLYRVQGDPGVNGNPGSPGIRGPPVSDQSCLLFLYVTVIPSLFIALKYMSIFLFNL